MTAIPPLRIVIGPNGMARFRKDRWSMDVTVDRLGYWLNHTRNQLRLTKSDLGREIYAQECEVIEKTMTRVGQKVPPAATGARRR